MLVGMVSRVGFLRLLRWRWPTFRLLFIHDKILLVLSHTFSHESAVKANTVMRPIHNSATFGWEKESNYMAGERSSVTSSHKT